MSELRIPAHPIAGADADAVVLEVEAHYAGKGPAPRKTFVVHAPDGSGPRIRLGGLFIACAVCGAHQPQSRSRQSPEARQLWVRMHLRCPETPASGAEKDETG